MEKVMTWEQIKEKYPDRWVFVKNYTMDGADIVSGEIICVCTDDEYGIGMSIRHFTPKQLRKISEKYGVELSDNQTFGNREYCFVQGADEFV